MDSWSLKEAEARFGEMLERCLSEGPQIVTRDGAEAAVLVPIDAWPQPAAVLGTDKPKYANLKDWLTTDHARADIPIPERGAVKLREVDFDD